jgi:hypothetical protein
MSRAGSSAGCRPLESTRSIRLGAKRAIGRVRRPCGFALVNLHRAVVLSLAVRTFVSRPRFPLALHSKPLFLIAPTRRLMRLVPHESTPLFHIYREIRRRVNGPDPGGIGPDHAYRWEPCDSVHAPPRANSQAHGLVRRHAPETVHTRALLRRRRMAFLFHGVANRVGLSCSLLLVWCDPRGAIEVLV